MKSANLIRRLAMALLVLSFLSPSALCRELAYPWAGSDHPRGWNCIQDLKYCEFGVDIGGSTGRWDLSLVNLIPESVVSGTLSVNGKEYSAEFVTLNGAQHYIVFPPGTPNGKAWIMNHASVQWDIYHKPLTSWPISYNNMEDECQRALDRGCYVLSLDAVVGGHPAMYQLMQARTVAAWLKANYSVSEMYWAGGSSGSVNVENLMVLSPGLVDGAILRAPIAFNLEDDLRYCAAWQQYDWTVSSAGYGWWYDPTDGVASYELYQGYYEGQTVAYMSAMNHFDANGIPCILAYGGDDERTHPDLWQTDLSLLLTKYLIDIASPGEWHGDHLVEWTDGSQFATTDAFETVENIVTWDAVPYSEPTASTAFDGEINPTVYTSASNSYLSEAWRIGFGCGGGLWDSAVVADVDSSDADLEILMGSMGGSFYKLEQGTDPAADDWTLDQGGAYFRDFGLATNALAIDDADNAVVGTMDGKLWMIDTDGDSVTGGGVNDFGHDIQHLYWTNDLDADGVDEWWFRTWDYYPTGIDGATLWVVEYNAVTGEFDTELEWKIGPWASQFFVTAANPHPKVTIHDGRGQLKSYQVAPTKNWKHDSKPCLVGPKTQHCFDLLKSDGTYVYTLTVRSAHHSATDPYTPTLPAKQLLMTFDATTLAKLDQEAIPDDSQVPTMDVVSEGGTTYVVVGGEGPKVYTIGVGGQITGPIEVAAWQSGRVLTCVRIADLDGDTVEEIVGVTEGGDIVNFIWSGGWGATLTVGDETLNQSKCFALGLHPTSGVIAASSRGYRWRLNPATGAAVATYSLWANNCRSMPTWNGTNYFPSGSEVVVDDAAGAANDDLVQCYLNTHGGDIIGCLVEHADTVLGGETQWYSKHIFGPNPNGYLGARVGTADFDADGDSDLACVTREGVFHTFEFTEGSTAEEPAFTMDYDLGVNPGDVVAYDLYGDSNLEILVPVMADKTASGRVHVLEATSDTLGYEVSSDAYIAPGVGVLGLAIGDLEDDGTDEFIIGCSDGTLRVYHYNAGSTGKFDLVHRSKSYGAYAGAYGGLLIYNSDSGSDAYSEVYAGGSDGIIRLEIAAE